MPVSHSAPVPAGPLVGYVTNGGYSRLLGRSTAVAYCAAASLDHPAAMCSC